MSSLLEVRDACVRYPQRGGLFSRTLSYLEAVSDVSFSLEKGLLFAKKDLSLRHAPAGSRVRMICRGVEPGAYSSGKSVEACHKNI